MKKIKIPVCSIKQIKKLNKTEVEVYFENGSVILECDNPDKIIDQLDELPPDSELTLKPLMY